LSAEALAKAEAVLLFHSEFWVLGSRVLSLRQTLLPVAIIAIFVYDEDLQVIPLIPVDEALETVLAHVPRLPAEEIDFREAPGRVLAEDVSSDIDIPPFSRSVMDGFALRSEDLKTTPTQLQIAGIIPAGTFPSFGIGLGQAARIMTGAPIPDGADAVQKVERTKSHDEVVEILEQVPAGENIVPRGAEVQRGDLVLKNGTTLDTAAVAVAATVGKIRLRVGARPRVAIITTGDELVSPSELPGPGQIRNSNAFSIAAQTRALGAPVTDLGVAIDDQTSLSELIEKGLAQDLLILSGGVSMGLFDLVKEVLAELDVKILFDKIALKPGKPTVFGIAPNGTPVFGLPGNPVSTMVTFELLVRPALGKMAGSAQPWRPYLRAVLKGPLASRGPRRAYLPGWLEPDTEAADLPAAYPIVTRGSGDMVAFSKANALLILPEDREHLEAGQIIQVYPLDSFLFKEDLWHVERQS
jgi:molybdopterin molybdotransferase